MRSLEEFAASKLAALEAADLRRSLADTARTGGVWAVRGGRRYLSFSCNDYLGLSRHPAVIAAAVAATQRYGAGAGASRLVTGNHPLYAELESRLARIKGTGAACVFGSGYLANMGIVPALVGEGDAVFADELSHACLWAGARLSRARTHIFRHNDIEHLTALLEAERHKHPRAMIVTDSVFSMDGDIAPLADIAALAERYDAWAMSDDAHGIGVLNGGRGASVDTGIALQMGTLSKAIGSYGGYLCASPAVIDLMKSRARTLVYSTGLPPGAVAASIAALDVIEADGALREAPLRKARDFTRALNLPLAQSPIVPLRRGTPEAALRAQAALEAEGFLVMAIRPPTVPDGTSRLRFAFSALHDDADIARLADAVRRHVS